MITSTIKKPEHPPKNYSILRGKQIHMYGLDTSHRLFLYNIQGKVSVSLNSDPVNAKPQVKNKRSNYWATELKYILDK